MCYVVLFIYTNLFSSSIQEPAYKACYREITDSTEWVNCDGEKHTKKIVS